jgi:hypothetical protein
LEDDQAIRPFEGLLCSRIRTDVAVEIGAGQSQDDRDLGLFPAAPGQCFMPFASMKNNEDVTGPAIVVHQDPRSVPQGPKNARPPIRRDAIAHLGFLRGRGNDRDSHGHASRFSKRERAKYPFGKILGNKLQGRVQEPAEGKCRGMGEVET